MSCNFDVLPDIPDYSLFINQKGRAYNLFILKVFCLQNTVLRMNFALRV